MDRIRYTLVTDGASDRLLMYPIDWLLARSTTLDFDGEWANPGILGQHPARGRLKGKVAAALKSYPCELLFVHRDAERDRRETRVAEIEEAVRDLTPAPPAVCVVPVRMTEAWLLIKEEALREAAGNPNGRILLDMPSLKTLESLPDPKGLLFDLLRKASGLKGRRLKGFRELQARLRLAELIGDFSPLESLPAFVSFQDDLNDVLRKNDWIRS